MRIRIKFTKNESVKYIGHLDIMRSFQRFFNRADVRMIYSEGFNPHQKMHFALPLGLGITSSGEYLDALIEDGQDLALIRDRINKICGNGFDITDIRQLKENADKAMASVRYASYSIRFSKDLDLGIDGYLNRGSIVISKKTKTGIRDVDIKNIIIEMKQQGDTVNILLKAGGDNNIKPELIINDMLEYNNIGSKTEITGITRTELFGPGIVPLIEYQTI